jgi:hypothetical protein
VRGESRQHLGFGREPKKKQRSISHARTFARAVSSSNALSSLAHAHGDPPTDPRERADFCPRARFGNFDLLLLLLAAAAAWIPEEISP